MKKLNLSSGTLFGLIYGLIIVLVLSILYVMGANAFVSPATSFFSYVVPIILAVWGGVYHRKTLGGYIDFSEALKTVFTIFVIGTAISTGFLYILLNLIDVPFSQRLAQVSAEATEMILQKFGAPQKDIDKAVDQILNGDVYSFKQQFLGFAVGTIWWFVVSLIIAAIIKKKNPETDNPFNS